MRKRTGLAVLLVLGAALVLPGCFGDLTSPRHDNPLDPDNPGTPSTEPDRPSGLSAVVSDRRVVLSWAMADTVGVGEYRVYRWDVEEGEDEDYELVDTVEPRTYEDTAVLNGLEYSYKVAAVNTMGLEGLASRALSVVPRVFGISIAGGRAKTATRNVTLTMSAPVTTELMRVSNSSNVSAAPWVPYQTSLSWELTPGDGEKTVYAQFRDAGDSQSEAVSDDIILDTSAIILSVTEDTGGEVMHQGDVIHFALSSGEPYGEAWVDIGDAVRDLTLYDDGTAGDVEADDGVYERDYEVEFGVEVVRAAIVGGFVDEVGNEAAPVLAPGTVTVEDPPTPVFMLEPTPLTKRSIALSWTRNNDADFDRYKLYRSYIPGVGSSTERRLIAELSDQGGTDFADTGLEPDSTYYYAVYVVDEIGLSSISNEVAGTTLANEVPAPVVLYAPWPDTASLTLSWSQSDEDDFQAYELFAWEQDPPSPPNPALKRVIARLTSRDDTFHTHESLVEGLVYWYEVAVVDSFGARAVSNTVSGSPRPPLR